MPSRTPTTPPKEQSMALSNKNCSITWNRFAPTAIRRPISLVRSATATSMMFSDSDTAHQERDSGDGSKH